MSNQTEHLLTPREVTQRLRCSVSTLRRLTRSGRLPVVWISERLPRYRATDLKNFEDAGGVR